jgi:hypothetical protein
MVKSDYSSLCLGFPIRTNIFYVGYYFWRFSTRLSSLELGLCSTMLCWSTSANKKNTTANSGFGSTFAPFHNSTSFFLYISRIGGGRIWRNGRDCRLSCSANRWQHSCLFLHGHWFLCCMFPLFLLTAIHIWLMQFKLANDVFRWRGWSYWHSNWNQCPNQRTFLKVPKLFYPKPKWFSSLFLYIVRLSALVFWWCLSPCL